MYPRAQGQQQCGSRGGQHEEAEDLPGTEPLRHPSGWDLGKEIAPVKGPIDDGLLCLTPFKLTRLEGKGAERW